MACRGLGRFAAAYLLLVAFVFLFTLPLGVSLLLFHAFCADETTHNQGRCKQAGTALFCVLAFVVLTACLAGAHWGRRHRAQKNSLPIVLAPDDPEDAYSIEDRAGLMASATEE